MIVYGDPDFEEDAQVLTARLHRSAQRARSLQDRLRLLIEAGQLEQAFSDGAVPPLAAQHLARVTDLAAAGLYRSQLLLLIGSAEAGARGIHRHLPAPH